MTAFGIGGCIVADRLQSLSSSATTPFYHVLNMIAGSSRLQIRSDSGLFRYVRDDYRAGVFRTFESAVDSRHASIVWRRTWDPETMEIIEDNETLPSHPAWWLHRRLPQGLHAIRTEISYRPSSYTTLSFRLQRLREQLSSLSAVTYLKAGQWRAAVSGRDRSAVSGSAMQQSGECGLGAVGGPEQYRPSPKVLSVPGPVTRRLPTRGTCSGCGSSARPAPSG